MMSHCVYLYPVSQDHEQQFDSLRIVIVQLVTIGWTNVNLFHFPDSMKIAYLVGLTLQCSEINQSKQPLAW